MRKGKNIILLEEKIKYDIIISKENAEGVVQNAAEISGIRREL